MAYVIKVRESPLEEKEREHLSLFSLCQGSACFILLVTAWWFLFDLSGFPYPSIMVLLFIKIISSSTSKSDHNALFSSSSSSSASSSSQSSAAPWPLIIAANWCFPFDQELFYQLLAPFPKVLAGAKPRLAPAPTCPFFIIIIILFTIIIINIIILFVIIIIIIIVVIFILTIKISIVSSLSFSHNINWPGFPYTIEINTNINMS